MLRIWLVSLIVQTRSCFAADFPWPAAEFRGVWVATVSNIDWPSSSHLSTHQQKLELGAIVDKFKSLNFNAIVFQVRTSGDALYNSSLEPWSTFLTGTQGHAPSPFYDPLEYLIGKAHAAGLEVHAWFNPYRARAGSTSRSGLAPNHMANRFPSHAHAYGTNLWMDPGSSEVQDHIVNVYIDVAKRYDVDGLHMDDYFYPYPVSGQDFPDTSTYHVYQNSGGKLAKADWRRSNVDTMINRLNREIHAVKPYLKFGISPFGIWKPGHPSGINGLSAYDSLYADAKLWMDRQWLDYIAPQLYWRIDPPAQSYPALLDWWCQQSTHGRHVYTGNAASNAVTKPDWSVQELLNQIQISRNKRNELSLGNIQYSAKYFMHNDKGISTNILSLYKSPVMTPPMPWLNVPVPDMPQVTGTGSSLSWAGDSTGHTYRVVVYRLYADIWEITSFLDAHTTSTTLAEGEYAVKAVNRAGMESNATIVHIKNGAFNIIG
ncbi:glycosyl hydrolase YngK-like [Dreissena polymorpha]|uniref:Glycosyl hydrolase-like 10 domain-containing protein n=1 Tax=Dreissena polymorpha TaxID=45954 RepID=A0A9D4BSF1_DREPO|nr:glycosyl hydrolase YngK-like [Dreissena polymorpha]XP_052250942.1 glycosyl hydrolase YngK-like [Dreissena polymorpha]XP_052250943.1 glycosyl hydrolase YngK-like [Dreissena polymorpha]XP_052250944.1 glycosyl hydrolase YngK-like [Dreissena polymorpha]KAH3706519.1 hypothetical protein DPMN_065906 [Dreissena polymorpha]